jgi:hypothetical protein
MATLRPRELSILDDALSMHGGYVLDFSDRTFAQFFDAELGVDIGASRYRKHGDSKARRFRCFVQTERGPLVARALRALWEHRDYKSLGDLHESAERKIQERYFAIVDRIEGETDLPRTDAIDRFAHNETLDELVAAIERDVLANKPGAALDRLHTYCMKKFAHLLTQRGLDAFDKDTLNARAGRLFNPLRREGKVRPISDKIMRATIDIFELFNGIRNNESLAHDNELVETAEARFIFDGIVTLLRFLKAIEAEHFGP